MQLAQRAGISRNYLAAVEKGANVSISVLSRIARVLQIDELPLDSESGVLRVESQVLGEVHSAITRASEAVAEAEATLRSQTYKTRTTRLQYQKDRARSVLPSAEQVPANEPVQQSEPWWVCYRGKSTTVSLETVGQILEVAHAFAESSPRDSFKLIQLAETTLGEYVQRNPGVKSGLPRAAVLKERAVVLWRLGRYQESLRAVKAAESILVAKAATRLQVADLHYIRASVLRDSGKFEQALENLILAENAFREASDLDHLINSQITKGAIFYSQKKFNPALNVWLEAAELAESRRDLYRLSHLLSNIGQAFMEIGNLESCQSYLLQSRALTTSLGLHFNSLKIDWALAKLEMMKGDFESALQKLRRVRRGFSKIGNEIDAGEVALYIIELLVVMERFEEVGAICDGLVELFIKERMPEPALTAISLLRESALKKKLKPSHVERARTEIGRHSLRRFRALDQLSREVYPL